MAPPQFRTVTFHGEGAVVHAWGGLRCVDMFAGDVLEIARSTVRHHRAGWRMVRPIGKSAALSLRRSLRLYEHSGEPEPIADDLVPDGVRLKKEAARRVASC